MARFADRLPNKPDDDQIAGELTGEWSGRYAYFYGDWWEYSGGVWQRRNALQVREAIRAYMAAQRGQQREIKVSANRVMSVEHLLRGMAFVADDLINPKLHLLNLRNGLLNLETFVLEKHRQDVYFTWQLDFDYDEAARAPLTFYQYLRTSLVKEDGAPDVAMIALSQEMLGYCLTADTSKKVAFWLKGESNSGKSQLLGLIREMMRPLHGTINLNKIGESRFLLADAAGKRVVTFSEADEGSVLPDGLFKSLVGGTDEIQVEQKNKPAFVFVPQCKVVWAMNNPPRVLDRSDAVYNRIIFILFPHSIPKDQQIADLLERMMTERAGILNWAIAGLKRLREQGRFTRCERSLRALADYRLYNDEEAQFLLLCERKADAIIPAWQLQDTYRSWRKANGYASKSERNVRRDFERHGIVCRRLEKGHFYYGLTIPEEVTADYQ